MSELEPRQVDALRRVLNDPNSNGRTFKIIHAMPDLLAAAETLLAIDWLTDLFCPDCPRVDECDCDSEEPNCAHWAIHHREELLRLYREAQHGKS